MRSTRAGSTDGRPSERGAVLIQVGVALLALCAFTAFVVDQGVMWISRAQAQNAADAAALAGATSLAFDDAADLTRARAAAAATGRLNPLWGQAADVDQAADITVGTCPASAPGLPDTCVRANIYRNQQKHPLPTAFAQLASVTQQGVKAMAIAQAAIASSVTCLKPWALIDKWNEVKPGPSGWHSGLDGFAPSTFDRYKFQGSNITLLTPPPLDSYTAPTSSSTGTGFTVANDYGKQLALKAGKSNDTTFPAGWFMPLDVGSGNKDFKGTIKGCADTTYTIGDNLSINSQPGNKQSATKDAVLTDGDSLINQDPNAVWDPTLNGGKGGVRNSAYPISPRVVPVPLIDVDAYIQGIPTGKTTVRIANIIGVFVAGVDSNDNVRVWIMSYPGVPTAGATLTGNSAFLKTVLLVR